MKNKRLSLSLKGLGLCALVGILPPSSATAALDEIGQCIQMCALLSSTRVLVCDADHGFNTHCTLCGGTPGANNSCTDGVLPQKTVETCLDTLYDQCLMETQRKFRTCARECRGIPPIPSDLDPGEQKIVLPNPPGDPVIVKPPKTFFP